MRRVLINPITIIPGAPDLVLQGSDEFWAIVGNVIKQSIFSCTGMCPYSDYQIYLETVRALTTVGKLLGRTLHSLSVPEIGSSSNVTLLCNYSKEI